VRLELKKIPEKGDIYKDFEYNIGMDYHTFFGAFLGGGLGEIFIKGFLIKLFNFLERKFNLRIFISPPELLKNLHPKLWSPLYLSMQLKKAEIISAVRRIKNPVDEPPLFRYRSDIINDIPNSANGIGYSITSEEHAFFASLGEAVERYWPTGPASGSLQRRLLG